MKGGRLSEAGSSGWVDDGRTEDTEIPSRGPSGGRGVFEVQRRLAERIVPTMAWDETDSG